jgi:hypothetical protein
LRRWIVLSVAPPTNTPDEKENFMRKRIRLGAIMVTLAIALGAPALAAAADNSNCWGTVVSQRAVAVGDIGIHSSSFAGEARLGLRNVARLVLGADATMGDLGAALGSLDDIAATHCP